MTARIYVYARSVTQSGDAKSKTWRLDYAPEEPRSLDPLMGWTSSGDMKAQVTLDFATKAEAVAYAERNGIAYEIEEPTRSAPRRGLSYSDNFRPGRPIQWTH